jgi:molybdopterin-guanine dinucleotide biosynthesis protein A
VEVSALILAGGRATRLGGVDKGALVVAGQTIFERQVGVLAPRVGEIILATSAAVAGHRTVADTVPGAGPIAGIAAGLAATTTPWLLVIAGDMPYVTGALIDRMLAAALDDADIDAVGIRIGELPEPLLCLLRVATARPPIDRRLAAGQLKVSHILTDDALRVAWLADVDPHALKNINAPHDLDG